MPEIQLPSATDLPDDPALLRPIIVQLLSLIEKRGQTIEQLQQQLAALTRRLYGRSSERFDPNQVLMDEVMITALEQRGAAPAPVVQVVEKHTRKVTPHGRTIFPETLRHEEVIIPVPENERVCPITGQERPVIGYEECKKLEYRAPEVWVRVYKREKRGSLPKAEEVGVVTAPPPEGPIAKGSLDNGLLAHLVVSKFVDHLPLYRQEKIFKRLGVTLNRRTLCDSLLQAAVPLQGLAELVRQRILANRVVHHDDTPVDLQGEEGGRGIREARYWASTVPVRAGPWVHFTFTLTREGKHVTEFFDGYQGAVMSDDFSGYGMLDPSRVVRLCCWAHARRKFFEAQSASPLEATEMLERIKGLYTLEGSVPADPQHDGERLRLRQEQAVPLLEGIHERLSAWALTALPKSPLGKAVAYTVSNWKMLTAYVEDPVRPIDNNPAEQVIRPVALGRKNWLFVGSERGGQAAATYMTLLASCQRTGLNPYDYFRDLFARIMAHPAHRLDQLLPDIWKPAGA